MMSRCIIVTNNRFTADAVAFAKCCGIELLSWDYPPGSNIRTLNDGRNLYPVTAMTTITIAEKEALLAEDILLAREVESHGEILARIGISSSRIKNVMAEATALSTGTK